MRILNLIVFIIIIGVCNYSNSQGESTIKNIFFGDIETYSSTLGELSFNDDGNVFGVRYHGSFGSVFSRNRSNFSFELIEDYTISNSKPMRFIGDRKKTNLIDYTFLGDAIIGISHRSTLSINQPSFFYHYIDPKLKEKINYGFPLTGFDDFLRSTDLSRVKMLSSPKHDYAALIYQPQSKSNEFATFKYAIFNKDFSTPSERTVLLPFESRTYKTIDFIIKNEKEQIFLAGHYPDLSTLPKRTRGLSERLYQRISINHITDGELKSTFIESQGIFYINSNILVEDTTISVAGYFSTFANGNIEGIYLIEIDNEGNILTEQYSHFNATQQMGINEFKIAFLINSSSSDFRYNNHDILSFKKIKDGFVLISEYNAIEYQYGTSSFIGSANSADNIYYWSGDVVLTKLDNQGNLLWNRVIKKSQRTINDGGYYLSSSVYYGENNIHLLFNDDIRNYNAAKRFELREERPRFVSFGKNNTLAHVQIDYHLGETLRNSIINNAEIAVFAVPQLFTVQKEQKKMFLYGRRDKRHRFGSIVFNE